MSETPGVIRHGPIVLGDGTEEVLKELGYTPERIAELAAARVVGLWKDGEPLLEGPRRIIGGTPKGTPSESAASENA
jgi:hypothetical protein